MGQKYSKLQAEDEEPLLFERHHPWRQPIHPRRRNMEQPSGSGALVPVTTQEPDVTQPLHPMPQCYSVSVSIFFDQGACHRQA